ncbi:AMP-binding protein [Blattabacterium cuenoti]|uniref:AMP-binding protein n=1 Tax=Blattabacterium cuenoti TaxID=1653831 RepID=UPI00163B8C5D|nr:AMP-binding protein [Blattabacterium cuenoti]
MEYKEYFLGMWIYFSSNKISVTNLVLKGHPLYQWQESILSFLKNWNEKNQTVLMGFTSGTTGNPKRIFMKKKWMYESAKRTVNFLNLKKRGTIGLLCLSPDSIASKMFLIRAMIFQWNIYCIPPSSTPLENIEEFFDIASMVPMQVFSSINHLYKIRIVLIGGSSVSVELEERLQKISTICYATYGMTETLGHIALRKINGLDRVPYFQSFDDVYLSIDKRNCLGIYNMESFIQTNDMVHLISDHEFNWIGRFDNIINSGGIKILPELIEKEIYSFIPSHRRFLISSIPDKILGEKIVLIIEGSFFSVKIPQHVFIGKKKFYKPRAIFFVKNFIENSFGKLKRKEIRNFVIKNLLLNE